MIRRLSLSLSFLFALSSLKAQTAFVPTSVICPSGQFTVATPTSSVSTFSIVSFSCLAPDSTVKINTTVTPNTITAITIATQVISSLVIVVSFGNAPVAPGPCNVIGALGTDTAGYFYICAGSLVATEGTWMRSAAPMVSTW